MRSVFYWAMGGRGEEMNIYFKPQLQITLFIETLSTLESPNTEERNSLLGKLLSEMHVVLCRYFRKHTYQIKKKRGRMYINKGTKKKENWQRYERVQTE